MDNPKYVIDTANTFQALLQMLKSMDNPSSALDLHLSLNARTDYIKTTTELLKNEIDLKSLKTNQDLLQEYLNYYSIANSTINPEQD